MTMVAICGDRYGLTIGLQEAHSVSETRDQHVNVNVTRYSRKADISKWWIWCRECSQ